jgi:transposase
MRPRPGASPVVFANKLALSRLGSRVQALEEEVSRIDNVLSGLVMKTAPQLLGVYGVGVDSAASLLMTAGDNPQRLRSEAAFANLCGVCPIEASSGKVTRHRLNRGGDRQANQALWRIVMTRMAYDARTRQYVERKTKEGKSKREIMRVLKRYVAREIYRHLVPA